MLIMGGFYIARLFTRWVVCGKVEIQEEVI